MGYIDVAGTQVWHEVAGDGDPLVLLHGGFASASSFYGQTPVLAAAGYRVYVPERRAHGHTRDVEGPITYSLMADDTIAYLETAVQAPAHLVGWSDGAVVALLVALRRPELVRRMVLIGQYYNSSGKIENPLTDELLKLDTEVTGFLRQMYAAESPDGADHFPVVHAKMVQMFLTEPELDLESLRGVETPTLVLQGDRDEVTVEHSQAVADTLAKGRLAVLPGTHMLPLESPDVLNALLVSYLRGDPPESGF
ncbi:MAG TPA: alpha/beta hydrolase [Frankiaceae bacterium]|jgi:pimeloyl-ACP methyl ester carboxylesterase|nr:alpha/beta hydrolase [Frankiaceae bacterium]